MLFNVPISSESSAEERIGDDINFLKTFCRKGLESCFDIEIDSAIRLERKPAGIEQAVKDKADRRNRPRPRPLKFVRGRNYDKEEIFKKRGNLTGAEMRYKSISMFRDYSRQTKGRIEQMIAEARSIDNTNAVNNNYSV